jgi:hypothetical protein
MNLINTIPQELIEIVSINLEYNDILNFTDTLELNVDFSYILSIKYPAFYIIISTCKKYHRYYKYNFTWESAYIIIENLDIYLYNKLNHYELQWENVHKTNPRWRSNNPRCLKYLGIDIDKFKKCINYKDPNKFFNLFKVKDMYDNEIIDLPNALADIKGLYLLVTKYQNTLAFKYRTYFPTVILINGLLYKLAKHNINILNIDNVKINLYDKKIDKLLKFSNIFIYVLDKKDFSIEILEMLTAEYIVGIPYDASRDIIYLHILKYIKDNIVQ